MSYNGWIVKGSRPQQRVTSNQAHPNHQTSASRPSSPGVTSSHPKTFGKWLSDALKDRQISQRAFADRIGVSASTINRWVADHKRPGRSRIRQISLVLEVDVGLVHDMVDGERSYFDPKRTIDPLMRDVAVDFDRLPPHYQQMVKSILRSIYRTALREVDANHPSLPKYRSTPGKSKQNMLSSTSRDFRNVI